MGDKQRQALFLPAPSRDNTASAPLLFASNRLISALSSDFARRSDSRNRAGYALTCQYWGASLDLAVSSALPNLRVFGKWSNRNGTHSPFGTQSDKLLVRARRS